MSGCNREGRSRCKNKNIGNSGFDSHQFGSLLGGLHWSRAAGAGRGWRCWVWVRARAALCSRGAKSFLPNNILDKSRALALRFGGVLFDGFLFLAKPLVVLNPPCALRVWPRGTVGGPATLLPDFFCLHQCGPLLIALSHTSTAVGGAKISVTPRLSRALNVLGVGMKM